jgi:anti-sigma factor RsiW
VSRPLPTCREIFAFLADYLDDALGAEERAAFERHLTVCPACVAYLDGYRETIRLARETLRNDAEAALPDVPDELVSAILRSRKT